MSKKTEPKNVLRTTSFSYKTPVGKTTIFVLGGLRKFLGPKRAFFVDGAAPSHLADARSV